MLQDIFDSIFAYGRAFRIISRLRLWGYFLIPGLISLLLGMGVYYTAKGLAGRVDDWLLHWYPWEWGSGFVESASYWVSLLLVWGVALLLFKHIILVLASPFMSPLSERIEREISGFAPEKQPFSVTEFGKAMVRGLSIAIRNITRELFYTFGLMLLSFFIPVIGPVVSVLIFLVQAYYAGFGNMDFTLERHFGVSGSARFVRQHRGVAIGNGLVFLGLFLTGIGVLIAPPLAAAAATLQTVPRLSE